MGAVIRMSGYVPNRRALFDIAAAGPLAGVVLAVPISFVGLMLSEQMPLTEAGSYLILGDPLLFQFFQYLIYGSSGDDVMLLLHPVGLAGWFGLLVTALNLFPIGQLDGGHISYAVFGRWSHWIGWTVFGALAILCLLYSVGYALFLILLLLLMRLRHQPTANDTIPLGRTRRWLAWLMLGVFVVCFTPTPLSLEPAGEQVSPADTDVAGSLDREHGLAQDLAVREIADPAWRLGQGVSCSYGRIDLPGLV